METPRYLLHEPLAAGGMGVVHLGTLVSPAGERRVAIKLLAERGRLDDGARARLIAEARLVFQLTHTNVCQVLDLGENEQGTFVVMEFIAGLDLRRLLAALAAQRSALDVASAVYIAREVARALDYAHRRTDARGVPLGLVHGDVTPQNILLSVEGEVKLADFGIARALGGAAPGAGLRAGTPGYVAPEVGGDHRVDIYALGVTLAVALTGADAAEAPRALEGLRDRRPDVSHELESALRRAMARDPRQRFLAAADFERVLSIELARSWQTFTPSRLAAIVRAHAHTAPGRPQAQTGMLQSVIGTAPPTIEAPRPASPRDETRTSTHARPRRWRGLAAAGAVAVAMAGLVAAGVGWRRAASRAAAPASAPATPTSPPATGPAAAATATTTSRRATEPPAATPALADPPAIVEPPPRDAKPSSPSTPRANARIPLHAGPPRHGAAPAANAFLSVNATPWGSIYVDGRRVAGETPVYRLALPAGDHVVQVRFGDDPSAARSERVHIVAGEMRTIGFSR